MIRTLLIAATAVSFIALPAAAQSTGDNKGGHHYSGGPREPHHMGAKETTGKKTKSAGGSHHYSGGPKSEVPHHMGAKKDQ